MSNFGEELRKLRRRRGLSQKELALAAGISPSYLSRIERGERGLPNPACLSKLAKALQITLGYLLALAGYDSENTAKLPPHWHSLVADPSLDEVISELGGLTSAELKGLQLYLQAIKLQRNKESKKPENR